MTPTTDRTIRLSPAFEAKATAQGAIEGLAAVFGGAPDSYGDVIEQGAFQGTLTRHKAEGATPVMLWGHDPARVVGRWTALSEASEGLAAKGLLNLKTEAGREAFEHVRAGDVSGLSIGYRVVKARDDGAARVLTEIDLAEVSIVALPAHRGARIRAVKDAPAINSRADLRDLLHKTGLPRGAAEKLASGGWPALQGETPNEHHLRQIAEKAERLAEILKGL